MRKYLTIASVAAAIGLCSASASAQYQNSAFGLDVGYWLISQPTVVDKTTGASLQGDRLPLRVRNGVRFGGETNFKMDEDHFWFSGRVNVGFLQFPLGRNDLTATLDEQFDYAAHKNLGTIFGVQGLIGVRYVFLTDQFRPYIQGGLSFLRLMSFASTSDQTCDITGIACNGGNNSAVFLAHPNVGGAHITPGLELILKRDIALNLFVDIQRWLIFNAADNTAIVAGVGVLFFG